MKIDIVMPQMGESVAEGTVASWLKKKGDKIEKGEPLLEITTDKVDTEIPAPESGRLQEILVKEGDTVEVNSILGRIQTGEGAAEMAAEPTRPVPVKAEEEAGTAAKLEAEEKPGSESPRITPVARQVVEKERIAPEEVHRIEGSGAGGRVTKKDVLQYLEEREVEPAAAGRAAETTGTLEIPQLKVAYDRSRVEVIPMGIMRKKIAQHMVYSKQVSPHVYTAAEVDMSLIASFRNQVKDQFQRQEGFKLTFTPFILQATAQSLKEFPIFNSSVDGENIVRKLYINLGLAVALEEGLIVPVIKNADEKNLLGLARAVEDVSKRARQKKLNPEDVQEGTFTVTNPGVFGNTFGFAVINQPQVGILDVGAIKKRPVVIDDGIAIRSIMYVSISYDHRIIDGATAARFLQSIVHNLENFDLERAL